MALQYGTPTSSTAYERFEKLRLKSLGLNEKYSRYYLKRISQPYSTSPSQQLPTRLSWCNAAHDATSTSFESPRPEYNSVAPFATAGKTTCGYGFRESTDNRRKDFGIDPADIPRWRNEVTMVTSRPDTTTTDNSKSPIAVV
jgi:hypothetical protein